MRDLLLKQTRVRPRKPFEFLPRNRRGFPDSGDVNSACAVRVCSTDQIQALSNCVTAPEIYVKFNSGNGLFLVAVR
jgi:hypothetical protein